MWTCARQGKLPPAVLRLPLALAVMLLAFAVPASLAFAEEPVPEATVAQDDTADGEDSTDATDAGTVEGDSNGDGVVDCVDFSTQEDAQVFFDANSDNEDLVLVLDSDGNGIACEELSSDPSGGVSTGDGGTALLPGGPASGDGGSTSGAGAALVLVALLSAAGALALLRRRPLGR